MYSKEILSASRKIFDYLNFKNFQTEKNDIIIGFGHFDMKIPKHCGDLFKKGLAQKILFTGGIGAGSADLQEVEALEFKRSLLSNYPSILEKDVILETESTNTGENIIFSEKVLKSLDSKFCLENGIKKVIAVASPYRQKRVNLTLKKYFPDLQIYNSAPKTTFEEELKLFSDKNEDFIKLLFGELERIKDYPKKGFMEYEKIPEEIEKIYIEYNEIIKSID